MITLLEQMEDTILNLYYWEYYKKMAKIKGYKKVIEMSDKYITQLKEELNKLKERQE